jgi:hypothetical protein
VVLVQRLRIEEAKHIDPRKARQGALRGLHAAFR